MKSIEKKSILTAIGTALALYPVSFLFYVSKDYTNLMRYVGTEYDVLMASAWLIGTIIFFALSLYKATSLIRNVFGGLISSYAVSMTLFSHQHALSQYNRDYVFLRISTIVVAIVLIILLIKNYRQEKLIGVKKSYGMEIAALSTFYYGLSLVVLNLILNTLLNSLAFHITNILLYCVWIFAAISGVLCISRKRLPFLLTLLINLANTLLYIALSAGTVYFGENISEALESGIPGLYISLTLIILSRKSLWDKKRNI